MRNATFRFEPGEQARKAGDKCGRFKRLGWFAVSVWVVSTAISGAPNAAYAVPEKSPATDGERWWRLRSATRTEDGSIDRTATDHAIASFEAESQRESESIEARLKLVEGLYFLGHFVVTDGDERANIFDHSVAVTNEMLAILARRVGKPDLNALDAEHQAELLRAEPDAAAVHFWAAIDWGLWGLANGYVASGTKGVASRIRRHARIVIDLDDTYADGGGYRLLGRLHTVAPRIPFVTWWIDRDKGIDLLRRAYSISKRDARNGLFLAEALLKYKPSDRPEALRLLQEVAQRTPARDKVVEESEVIDEARAQLKTETGGGG